FSTENENQNQSHSAEIKLHEEPETVNDKTILLPPSSEPLANVTQDTVLKTDTVLKELIKDLTENKQNTPL
ncbi:34796_t:CDS:1, partial [Gigaspora margarita]